MKSAGYVRQLDELGRIVLPIELRRIFGIEHKDGVEIFTNDDCIILHKYQPACMFCGGVQEVKDFKGKKVCNKCLADLSHKAI